MSRRPARWEQRKWVDGPLVIGLSLTLYLNTLCPTVTWGDPAKLTVYAHTLYLRVWAANHALHNLVGWLWGQLPFADYAYGQNLLSAVFASLTVGVIYFITLKLTSSRWAATLAALSLGVSHTFWWLAVIAESYSLLFFLLAVCIFSALAWGESRNDRWLYLFSFAFGLGITNHAIVPLFAPAFALYFLLEEPRFLLRVRRLIGMVLAFLGGLSLLIGVFVYSLRWYTAWQLVQQMTAGSLAPYWRDVAKIARETIMYLVYLGYQFPGLGLLLGVVGAWVLFHRDKKAFAFLIFFFVLDVVFSAGYMYQRQFETLVPSYLAFAIAIGVGTGYLWEKLRLAANRLRRERSAERRGALVAAGASLAGLLVLAPVLTYYAVPPILRYTGLDPLGARYIPYRDNARYFFLPDKSGYDGAARYGREVLEMLPPDAVILADFTPGAVLKHMQTVERLRPDVLIVGVEIPGSDGQVALKAIRQHFGDRPMYLTDYRTYPRFFAINELASEYEFAPQGHTFLLNEKQESR